MNFSIVIIRIGALLVFRDFWWVFLFLLYFYCFYLKKFQGQKTYSKGKYNLGHTSKFRLPKPQKTTFGNLINLVNLCPANHSMFHISNVHYESCLWPARISSLSVTVIFRWHLSVRIISAIWRVHGLSLIDKYICHDIDTIMYKCNGYKNEN